MREGIQLIIRGLGEPFPVPSLLIVPHTAVSFGSVKVPKEENDEENTEECHHIRSSRNGFLPVTGLIVSLRHYGTEDGR